MVKRIIASIVPEETRMALLENGELMEVSVERSQGGNLVGNIYKGRIKNVLPGMQAAFIDIGRDKNAFLYVGDIFPHIPSRGGFVDEVLTAGQDIMIQIVKDAIGTKGPRATTHITLPGRYAVLMPTVDYIGISRRIEAEEERERLKALAEKVRPTGMGMIIRTVAEGKCEEEMKKDVEYLHNLWQATAARAKRSQPPALIYRDVNLVIRIVRDYLTDDVEEFVLDNREAYTRVCDLLNYSAPEMVSRITLYEGRDDIFVHYGLAQEMGKIGQRHVSLKSGGYLVIDRTEALTVIDVNTGRFVGNTNLSDTVYRTNLEAAEEIARQIRLRDIGGIIIIDFIDMDKEEQKKAIIDKLSEKMKNDRSKTNILGLTALGLVEMTRKKVRRNFEGTLFGECPVCGGRGRLQSPETVAISVKRELRRLRQRGSKGLVVQVHPRVAEELQKHGDLEGLIQELGISVKVEVSPGMNPEVFSMLTDEQADSSKH